MARKMMIRKGHLRKVPGSSKKVLIKRQLVKRPIKKR